jgi:glyoxylase-like metal-dependent hydrolase (beta-lactamase superfamily II)
MEDRSRLVAGTAIAIADGVRRLVAGNAGMMTGPGTNTYLLGHAELAVLDPGPADAAHLRSILEAAGAPIRWVVVTHTHSDHSPLARELAKATGAELIGVPPPGDGRQDLSFVPQRVPADGEMLALGELRLQAVRTPGHASNCVCYLLESARMLFSGDHVLEGVTPVILPPDGDMGDYLDSVDKLMPLPFDCIAPGHGGVIEDAKGMLNMLRKHRLMREAKVVNALRAAGAASIEELTPRVYDDVPKDRHRWAQLTLEAHLLKLLRDQKVTRDGRLWALASA